MMGGLIVQTITQQQGLDADAVLGVATVNSTAPNAKTTMNKASALILRIAFI
jgi:hypothetical protein